MGEDTMRMHYKRYGKIYDKMVKGHMDFLEPKWSDISFFYEDFNKVWKPNEKGLIGRFEMRYKVPVFQIDEKNLYWNKCMMFQ